MSENSAQDAITDEDTKSHWIVFKATDGNFSIKHDGPMVKDEYGYLCCSIVGRQNE